jgi:hypothetical protein
MNKLAIVGIVFAAGVYGNHYLKNHDLASFGLFSDSSAGAAEASTPDRYAHFVCDGRTHCSQMTSCAEAAYFVQNCPGVKMDGDRDGIPCERQWCQ